MTLTKSVSSILFVCLLSISAAFSSQALAQSADQPCARREQELRSQSRYATLHLDRY